MPSYSVPGCRAKFSERPGSLQYVIDHHRQQSIMQLSRSTGVAYANVAEALRRRDLMADRYTRKGATLRAVSSLTESESAYLAGIIDGEGTITIAKTRGIYYRPNIVIANTSSLLRDWLASRGFNT